MTITLTREEAQQVLDAFAWELGGEPLGTEINKAVQLLRARLAQPEPEFETHEEGDDGWCDWTYPIHKGYLMKCCDCGLVYEIEFHVLKNIKKKKDGSNDGVLMDDDKYQVGLRMRRNE